MEGTYAKERWWQQTETGLESADIWDNSHQSDVITTITERRDSMGG